MGPMDNPYYPESLNSPWRCLGSYKWSYMSPNMGYNYSYPTYNPTYKYP